MHRMIIASCLITGLLSVAAASKKSHAQLPVTLEVEAGAHDRINCPVVFPLPRSVPGEQPLKLVRAEDQQPVPIQIFGRRRSRKIAWMIEQRLPSGHARRYELQAADGPSAKTDRPMVACEDDGRAITVSRGNSPVLTFNHQVVESPAGIDPVYRRGGYLHPVFTPAGRVVTGDFEPDHPHQHGIFFAWVNTTFAGQAIDFWNQAKRQARIEVSSLGRRVTSGPVFGQFTARLSHIFLTDDQPVTVLAENWTVRVYNSHDPFLFEITSRQVNLTDEPLRINEYHYGGMALRGPSAWLSSAYSPDGDEETGVQPPGFMTSSGRNRHDGNHTRARWVEMHGPAGTEAAGIIALAARNNFRAPQTVRLHPTKPYFCFAPMVLGEFEIKSNEPFVSHFRFAVHDGKPDAEAAERLWQDFAHPPRVKVISKS